MLEWKDHRFLI